MFPPKRSAMYTRVFDNYSSAIASLFDFTPVGSIVERNSASGICVYHNEIPFFGYISFPDSTHDKYVVSISCPCVSVKEYKNAGYEEEE